jgi:hypothetical protein
MKMLLQIFTSCRWKSLVYLLDEALHGVPHIFCLNIICFTYYEQDHSMFEPYHKFALHDPVLGEQQNYSTVTCKNQIQLPTK